MLKSIVLGFLFISCASSFSYNMQLLNNKNDKPRVNLKRRDCIKVMPLVLLPILSAKRASAEEKSIEELREEANRIIEIIDAQKEAFNLPTLKKPDEFVNANSTSDNTSGSASNAESINGVDGVNSVLDNVMKSFKNNDAGNSINNLKLHCAPSNPLKSQNTNNLVDTFNNSKYAILLGKFYNYSYVNYEYYYDNEYNMSYYTVDVKVEADYKTMIYNSIQFDDMYYPESNANNNNMCYVIYRWTVKKDDNDYLIDSCYLIPK
jgi:hypothetical protein